MEQNSNTPFIFYLTLEENLPRAFYSFDKSLKTLGYMLVPVRIDQLQSLVSTADQTQIIVISSVSDIKEMNLYNERVRGLLKYVLKSKRITFMHCSSFSKLNDFKQFALKKNYYFLKYPLDAALLSKKIVRYYELKSDQNVRWPGGKRAGLGSVV
jgi:hypothetical protein